MSLPPAASGALSSRQLPGGLRTAQLVLRVQGVLGIVFAVSFIVANKVVANLLGLTGSAAPAVVVAGSVVLAAVSALVLWGAAKLAELNRRARHLLLAYEYLSVALGLVTFAWDLWEASLRTILAAVVIYYLQVDTETRTRFGLAPSIRPR